MSEIKDYIDRSLKSEYKELKILNETSVNKLVLYQHIYSGEKLVLIRSGYRNDEVFRKLKSMNTDGYTPVIYEVCSEDDYLYIIEEYVEGKTLSGYLENSEDLSEKDIIKYIKDLCCALEILHSLGIVHRDVKPENVIIRNGKACLIDFSVAKAINYSRKDTMSLGTAGYAAPEQYGITESNPATDIYALGVLANILITGEHPTTKIPGGKIGRIIRKCTDIQISKRYQSAQELKKQLNKL